MICVCVHLLKTLVITFTLYTLLFLAQTRKSYLQSILGSSLLLLLDSMTLRYMHTDTHRTTTCTHTQAVDDIHAQRILSRVNPPRWRQDDQ